MLLTLREGQMFFLTGRRSTLAIGEVSRVCGWEQHLCVASMAAVMNLNLVYSMISDLGDLPWLNELWDAGESQFTLEEALAYTRTPFNNIATVRKDLTTAIENKHNKDLNYFLEFCRGSGTKLSYKDFFYEMDTLPIMNEVFGYDSTDDLGKALQAVAMIKALVSYDFLRA
jgi:hypothetical protein